MSFLMWRKRTVKKVCGFLEKSYSWIMGSSDFDRQLVALYLKGDREATRLIEKYVNLALIPFRSRLQSHFSDIQQDVHISLLGILRGGEFRYESSLKHFVGRVVVNRALTLIDYQRIRQSEELEEESNIESKEEDPEALLVKREHWAKVVSVIRMASKECRRLWRLVLREGLTYAEIASQEQKAEETIKWRLFTCREQAKKNLEKLQKYTNLSPIRLPRST